MITKITKTINGVEYTLETGRFATQTQASILAQAGGTTVLTTVSVGAENNELDFFPLSVDYVEKLYAAGMISSSRFIKREGRPTDREIISARIFDRSIRSLFPEDLVREVQIITQVLSYDKKNSPEFLQILSGSTALVLAGLPFNGPVIGVRAGFFDGEIKYFPDDVEMNDSEMNLLVSVNDKAVVSIEADGKLIPEEIFEKVLSESLAQAKPFLDLQNEFVQKAGKRNFEYTPRIIPEELKKAMHEDLDNLLEKIVFIKEKNERSAAWDTHLAEMHIKYDETYKAADVKKCFDDILKEFIREKALKEKRRIDGRELDELRNISAEIGVLPRVHGSAVFNRGETQVLTVVTLGSSRLEQITENLEGEGTKRYMHHYNMAGFANGEVDRRFGMANRRSIGHGMIGEKSLQQVLPDEKNFKYTVRVVSEVLDRKSTRLNSSH